MVESESKLVEKCGTLINSFLGDWADNDELFGSVVPSLSPLPLAVNVQPPPRVPLGEEGGTPFSYVTYQAVGSSVVQESATLNRFARLDAQCSNQAAFPAVISGAVGGKCVTIREAGCIGGQVGGGHRGDVLGFSPGSRRRALSFLFGLPAQRIAMLTLTYPRRFPSPAKAKRHLRAFLKRLYAKYGKMGVFYRQEFQKRQAPHFHILVQECWLDRFDFDVFARNAWFKIAGKGVLAHFAHGFDATYATDGANLACYVSKYVAKVGDVEIASDPNTGEVLPSGRCWGIENRPAWGREVVGVVVSPGQAAHCNRVLRRLMLSQSKVALNLAASGKAKREAFRLRQRLKRFMRRRVGIGCKRTLYVSDTAVGEALESYGCTFVPAQKAWMPGASDRKWWQKRCREQYAADKAEWQGFVVTWGESGPEFECWDTPDGFVGRMPYVAPLANDGCPF
jgi:hypothetical protein